MFHLGEDPNPCNDTNLCNATLGNGVCVNLKETDANGKGYICLCGPFWTGDECETPVDNACEPNPCVNGTCILNSQFNTYTCECDPGFVGTDCDCKCEHIYDRAFEKLLNTLKLFCLF